MSRNPDNSTQTLTETEHIALWNLPRLRRIEPLPEALLSSRELGQSGDVVRHSTWGMMPEGSRQREATKKNDTRRHRG